MSYSSFHHPQPDAMFPTADPTHQIPSTFPMDQSQTFSTMNGGAFGSTYRGYDERNGYPGYSMTNPEEGVDAARGPRLTQEQLAQLELEFAQNYKPNTDHKRGLAERMGVDYSKVTNWFQNRRAKAKHEGHAQQRSDRSIQDVNYAFGSASMDYRRVSDSHSSANFSSPEQAPISSDDLRATVDFTCLNEVPPQYYSQPSSIATSQVFGTSTIFPPDTSNTGDMDPYAAWSGANVYSDHKIPTSSVHEFNHLGLMSASPSVHSSYPDPPQGNPEWNHPPMYNNIVGGQLGGNPSSQSFATSVSEEGEQANFITPPQETSPLPGAHQECFQHDRHASNSSELAENLDVIHIQPPKTGSVLRGNSNSISDQHQTTTTGLLTPEVSPDTVAPKLPFASTHDLASRRKRPRPAALQPEPNRSVSYAGPMTNSPSLRVSPPSSGKISPVRRVKSTGNPLVVMTGRVKKSGAATAQMSPRNLESCFKVASMPEKQSNMDHHSKTRQTSRANGSSLAAPLPASLPHRRQSTWPEFSAQVPLPSTSWQQGVHGSGSNANLPTESSWDIHQIEYPNADVGIISQPPQTQQYAYPLPPQSAPSHVTTFDTAAMRSGNIATDWQISHIQPEPYRDDTRLSVPFRPSHPQHHFHSGPFEYYQPLGSSYQPYGQSIGTFFPFASFTNRAPTPPYKALDIKVETGPPPPKEMMQTSQERKEYTFENAFADDPHFATGSKK